MTKNVFEVIQDVYDQVCASDFKEALTGDAYKFQLPVNVGGENLVLKCTRLGNEQLQLATIELHLYLPSVDVMNANNIQETQPDVERFSTLEPMLDEAVNGINGSDFLLDTASPGLIEWNKDLQLFYLNKQVSYTHENL